MAVNKVYLMLGYDCNLKCRHCVETGSTAKSIPMSASRAVEVTNYINALQEKREKDKPLTVLFWGGEPLAYFDLMKCLTKGLYHDIQKGFVSNGTLFTKEIVEWCNDNDVGVTLSNDGVHTEKVRKDILKSKKLIDLYKQLKNPVQFDSVEHAYNMDYFRTWDYWDEKMGRECHGTFEPLMVNWAMDEELYNFDFVAYKQVLDQVVNVAFQEVKDEAVSRSYLLLHQTVMQVLKAQEGAEVKVPKCGAVFNNLNVDLEGNIHSCHGHPKQHLLGTIYTPYEDIEGGYRLIADTLLHNSGCKDCSVFPVCGGGCILLDKHRDSKAQEKCCTVAVMKIKAAEKLIRLIEEWRGTNCAS